MKQFYLCYHAIILIICCTTLPCFAQYTIKGKIKDASAQAAVVGAQIVLLSDSTQMPIAQDVSDTGGKFILKNIASASYHLKISCMGYEPMSISLIGLSKNVDLGDILLTQSVTSLGEVTVSGSLQSRADRWIYYPSDVIKRQSVDAFDVLQRISLPDLQFDLTNHSISTLKQGKLQIRINGVIAQQSDLIALQPQDISKIEYVDNPGITYGEGVSAVILIVTKRLYEGLQGGTRLLSAVTTNWATAYAYFKWIGRKDFLNVKVNGQYQNIGGIYTNNLQQFHYPTSVMTLNALGENSRSKTWFGEFQVDYNHLLDKRNSFFNVTASYNRQWLPLYNMLSHVWKNDVQSFTELLGRKNKSGTMVLDLYLDKTFANRANLIANLIGTNIVSDYSRRYSKIYTEPAVPNYESAYDVDGWHRSIIGEVKYRHPLSAQTWLTLGTYETYSYTNNKYWVDGYQDPVILKNFNSYNYLELSGALGKLSYSLGGGYSLYSIMNDGVTSHYHFFRPSMSLSLPLSSMFRLQYYLNINPQEPTLAMRSNFSQTVSEYEISRGNPQLKPYQAYANQLSLSFRKGETYLSLTGYMQYNKHPFTNNPPFYDAETDKFIYTISNQNSFTHLQFRLYASHKLFSQSLNLSGYLSLNRYINDGLSFSTTYTGLLGGVTLSYDRPKWGMQANYRSAISYMFNETKTRMAPNLQLSGYYNLHKIRCTLSINNPLMKTFNTTETNSKVIQSKTFKYQQYNDNLITLTVSYNFRIGKTRSSQKQIENSDTDTGIIR